MRFVGLVSLVLLASSCTTIYDDLPNRRGVPLQAVQVTSAGEVVWRIEAPKAAPVLELRYGVVPPGFTQVVPVARPPRLLKRGEPLQVTYLYADRREAVPVIAVSFTGVQRSESVVSTAHN